MDEIPDRTIVYAEASRAEFLHQAAYREGVRMAAIDQPDAVLARDLRHTMAAHLTGQQIAPVAKTADPIPNRARCKIEPTSSFSARQPRNLNCPNNPFSQIQRVWSTHAGWPPYPARFLNHNPYILESPKARDST